MINCRKKRSSEYLPDIPKVSWERQKGQYENYNVINTLSFAPSESKSSNPNWKWNTTTLVKKDKTSQLDGHKYTEIHNFYQNTECGLGALHRQVAAAWPMLIFMWNGSTFWVENVKRKINHCKTKRIAFHQKWTGVLVNRKFSTLETVQGALNYRRMTFMFQLLLPLPQSWQRGWWTEAPLYIGHHVLQETNMTKFGAGLCEKERWFYFIQIYFQSFKFILADCSYMHTNTFLTCVHTHSRTLCCLCSERQGQDMQSLDHLPCLSFFFSGSDKLKSCSVLAPRM